MRICHTIRVGLLVAVPLLCLGAADGATATTKKHVTPAHPSATHSTAKSHKTSTSATRHGKAKGTAKARPRGQAAPDSERTREIQSALIREHFLTGEASGSWDNNTRDALARYQSANGWQTKLVPDSRALIKLGLGPSREGLLNPDTAAISPHELGAEKPHPGGSASN